MSFIFRTFYSSLIFIFILNFNNEAIAGSENYTAFDLKQSCLFVSLGSTCHSANITRVCNIRTASFPFDWIVSTDGERFIELLDHDFMHFFNKDFLVNDEDFAENIFHTPVNGNVLLNTFYHLEFLHEQGNWKTQFGSTMEIFKDRYTRRIARFRNLRNFPGKVYFMRSAHTDNDPHRFFRYKDNVHIDKEYAYRLLDSLKKYFPKLNFKLIILNNENKEEHVCQTLFDNDLIIVNFSLDGVDLDKARQIFQEYFYELLGEKFVLPNESMILF